MSHDRPRWMRIARLWLRRRLARLDRAAPAWLIWLPTWGTSLLAHGVVIVVLATVAYVSGRPSKQGDLDTSISSLSDGDLATLVSADQSGEPLSSALSDQAASLSTDPAAMPIELPSMSEDLKSSPSTAFELPMPKGEAGHLSSPFAGRQLDRGQLLRREGGTTESEKAVQQGLNWLMRHQREDGGWSFDVSKQCRTDASCPAGPAVQSDTAATGLALLAFLGAGYSHNRPSLYHDQVSRGIAWLVHHQKKTGEIFLGGTGNSQMYSHAIATMALCEAYGISKDRRLEMPAQLAIDFIVQAQNKDDGGWRYSPGMRGDTSVFGWQMFALRSAAMAGLNVSKNVIKGCHRYLDQAAADKDLTTYRYEGGRGPTPVMSAEALLCRQYLGWSRDHPPLVKGVSKVWDNLQSSKERNIYYWYYATQLLHNMQNDAWKQWNPRVRDGLIATQVVSKGCDHGSWSPTAPQHDHWGGQAGRLFQTSMSILTLEVYYRYLPLYRNNDRPTVKD